MTPPIIPVSKRLSLAWHPDASECSSRRFTEITRDGVVGRRVIDGRQLCIQDSDGYMLEFPSGQARGLDRLLSDPAPAESVPVPIAHGITSRLEEMAALGGFSFYPKQLEVVARVASVHGALIAAEVGCGKTLMAIALCYSLRPRRALIIAPQGVASPRRRRTDDEWVFDPSQWQREFARFAPSIELKYTTRSPGESDSGVFLTYMQDALLNNGGWLKDVRPDFFDMIVVDEAHLLMNGKTKMGQALFRMTPERRYGLTATPIPNRVNECTRLLDWLRPEAGIYHGHTIEFIQFGEKKSFVEKPTMIDSPILVGARLSQVIAAVRKIDIRPDLPPLHIHHVYVDPEPEVAERYRDCMENFTLKRGGDGQVARAKLTALRNICAESRAKAAAIAGAACSDRSVVVSARTAQTSIVERTLRGIRATGRIDSTTDPASHGAASASFQSGKIDNLLMGIKCAYGHSFPDCSFIHVASLEWSYGSFAQAVGRVHRINSVRPVHAYVYLLRGTVEGRMIEDVAMKRSEAESVLFGAGH